MNRSFFLEDGDPDIVAMTRRICLERVLEDRLSQGSKVIASVNSLDVCGQTFRVGCAMAGAKECAKRSLQSGKNRERTGEAGAE